MQRIQHTGTRARGLAAAVVVLAACLLGGCDVFGGLEARTVSPISGRKLTAGELTAEARKYDAEQRAEEARKVEEAQAALRKLRTDAELKAQHLTLGSQLELADLKARTDQAAQDIVGETAVASANRAAALAAMQDQLDLAGKDLERQAAQRAAAWNAVKLIPGATALPGFGAIESLVGGVLLTGGTAGVMQLGKRKLKRQNTTLAAEHASTLNASRRVVDSIDLLREIVPELDKAMSDPKIREKIAEWQGAEGKALVDALQKGQAPASATLLPLVVQASAVTAKAA